MNPQAIVTAVRNLGGTVTTDGKSLRLRWMVPTAPDDRNARRERDALTAQVTRHRTALYRFLMELAE